MSKITEDIKTGEFRQVYLIYGEERYMCRLYLSKLLQALECSDDSMNYTKFEGKQSSEDAIIEICETLPFFADRRVVLIEDTGLLREKSEKLADYFKELPEYLTVIFAEKEVDKRGRLYKAVAKYDRVEEFKLLEEKDIINWVLVELKKSGKKIKKSTLELFLNGTGEDLNFISCELEKLIAYTGEREEITADDISQVCSVRIDNKIFDMISDMAAGKRSDALKNYYDLILLKESPMKMLVLMERQFRQLLCIKQLSLKGQGERLIADNLKLHPFAVKKNMPLARKYSESELEEMLEKLVSSEEDIKSGRINERLAVELMLIS